MQLFNFQYLGKVLISDSVPKNFTGIQFGNDVFLFAKYHKPNDNSSKIMNIENRISKIDKNKHLTLIKAYANGHVVWEIDTHGSSKSHEYIPFLSQRALLLTCSMLSRLLTPNTIKVFLLTELRHKIFKDFNRISDSNKSQFYDFAQKIVLVQYDTGGNTNMGIITNLYNRSGNGEARIVNNVTPIKAFFNERDRIELIALKRIKHEITQIKIMSHSNYVDIVESTASIIGKRTFRKFKESITV